MRAVAELEGREQAGEAYRQGGAVGGDYAITGTLPTLDDVIAFKEGTAKFDHGYYRFVSHPLVRRLEDELKSRFGCRHCKLTESMQVALVELILCLHKPGAPCRIVVLEGVEAAVPFSLELLPACDREGIVVLGPDNSAELPSDLDRTDIVLAPVGSAERAAQATAAVVVAVIAAGADGLPGPLVLQGVRFAVAGLRAPGVKAGAVLGNADRVMDRLKVQVKRRGPTLSSRTASSFLGGAGAAASSEAPARVADALCRLEGGTRAFLYSSGMSAITRVLDLLRCPEKPQVVAVGHLYNDTYQTLRLGPNRFAGVDEREALAGLVSDQAAAILTETITNPLSDVPDLDLLSQVARSRGIPLVVDNTLATPVNCRPFEHGADVVIHSTTKYLNGANDHAGGAVIVKDPLLAKRLADCQFLLDDQMSSPEAHALEQNLASFPRRMARFNDNARKVAGFLAGHRAVERVYFNSLPSHRSFATAGRLLRGPGSVISFTLVQADWERLRAFYDAELRGIVKAPSLGSDVTLLCPYTLLTHYEDTDAELAAIGLPRFLLRVSVGCEDDVDTVIASLGAALAADRGSAGFFHRFRATISWSSRTTRSSSLPPNIMSSTTTIRRVVPLFCEPVMG